MRVTSVKTNHLLKLVTVATSAIFLVSCDASEPTSQRSINKDTIWLSPDRPVPPAPLQIAASSSQTSSAETTTKTVALPPIMSLTGTDVCAGVKFRDSNGHPRTGGLNCSITFCVANGVNGATDCKITGTLRSVDKSAIAAIKDKMTTSATIVGVQGTFNPNAYKTCTYSTEGNCTTTAALPAMSQSDVHEGVIKAGTHLGPNLTGKYPSTTYHMAGYDGAKTQLTNANMTAALGSTVGYQYWNFKGESNSLVGHANFKKSNIITNKTIYGLPGTASVTTATTCAAEGDTNCLIPSDSDLVAIDS